MQIMNMTSLGPIPEIKRCEHCLQGTIIVPLHKLQIQCPKLKTFPNRNHTSIFLLFCQLTFLIEHLVLSYPTYLHS